MNLDLIHRVLGSASAGTIDALLAADDTVFWVDWRDEDDQIVSYCESILQTWKLSAEVVDAENEAGFEMYINYKDRRVKVPLVIGTEDRHITLCTLNEVLSPDHEIRLCVDSNGSDTLAFLPLSSDTWCDLDTQYGDAVTKRFYKFQTKPNVFTDRLPF